MRRAALPPPIGRRVQRCCFPCKPHPMPLLKSHCLGAKARLPPWRPLPALHPPLQERFKGLERELKIKQFSSEGLKRDSTDPVRGASWRPAGERHTLPPSLRSRTAGGRPTRAQADSSPPLRALAEPPPASRWCTSCLPIPGLGR